jgi:transglutaminase-like putative cysteine protease
MKTAQVPATLAQLRWLCACLALALAPHVAHLPGWLVAVTAGFVLVRLVLAARQRPPPPRLLRMAIAAVSLALLWIEYRTFNGLEAGTALLCLVAGLKFLETQSRRDLYVVTFIVYFLSLAALLNGESFWLLGYLIAVAGLTTAMLLRATPARPLDARASARRTVALLAQALPIALVLWLLFPRFDGPLWQIASEARAQSGLSDTLSPGDITELALSDEIAFRVYFLGATPPRAARYWRGPVLHEFDGRTWRGEDSVPSFVPQRLLLGTAYRYRVRLEPHAHRWIFTLDWPASWNLAKAALNRDEVLEQPDPVTETLDVVASSYSEVRATRALSAAERLRNTALPAARNPRTLELAQRLRQAHPHDLDYVRAVLEMIRAQPFYYTLTPPALADNPTDEFLFDTRRGFCGHYASAFAALMRAAGIPARVVTGYLGGTYNRFAGYWIVRQSDAHAWDEVWIEGRGWTRFDPTGAVAPERVERGINESVAGDEPLASRWQRRTPWLGDLRLGLDALHEWWRERVVRYSPGLQLELLHALRIPQPDAQKLVMILAASLGLVLVWLTWQVRRETRPAHIDPLQRAYARLCRKLAAAGLARRPAEGPLDFAARVGAARPDLAAALSGLCERYAQLRYGAPPAGAAEARATFIRAVRVFSARSPRARGDRASS